MRKKLILASLIFSFHLLWAGSDYRLSFDVKINDETTNLKQFSYFILPGDTITISVTDNGQGQYSIYNHAGKLIPALKNKWLYIAPSQKGYYRVLIQKQGSDENMLLKVFVMVPATDVKNGYLNGYRIGNYPDDTYKNKKNYKKPEGFIEVTPENEDLFLSPHFQLKQFLCKQESGWPKYVVVKTRMLKKLELILEKLNGAGVKANTLFLMSAYRTPYYNKAIGNVKYSRHIYGDAVDIYVDENHDAVIDDLDHDGKSTVKDAEVIRKTAILIDNDPEFRELVGGIGKYNKNASHTYFIHIDTRGYKARW